MTNLALQLSADERTYVPGPVAVPWRRSAARLLVVEDDADLRHGLTLWLRHQGYSVGAARDGVTGLRAVHEQDPDILLLDLGLPGMHGFKLLHQLRQRRVTPPRTIVLTAAAAPDVATRAMRSGAQVVFTKPADPPRLLQAIDDLLKSPGYNGPHDGGR